MAKRGNADIDDFESREDRTRFALNLREGLTPEGVIEDWGDLDEDDRSLPSSKTDVHCADIDEVEGYYNDTRPSGWWPL